MGTSQPTPQSPSPPTSGSRIIQITNPSLQPLLQTFTDFIIQPSLPTIKASHIPIKVTIFSILNYQSRQIILPISQRQIGIKVKQTKINDCMLKITKVFSGSPCEQLGIQSQQYIVGLLQSEYQNLKDFAMILKGLLGRKIQMIHMAICDAEGKTRMVGMPFGLLEQWKGQNKGILGCQLAQGWMNRFRFKKKEKEVQNSGISNLFLTQNKEIQQRQTQDLSEQTARQQMKQLNKRSSQELQQQWQQVQRKCGQLKGHSKDLIQINFKGLLKNQYLDDASTICKCKIYDKHCQRCFVQREGGYYFFNKKTNRIVVLPAAMMFKVDQL